MLRVLCLQILVHGTNVVGRWVEMIRLWCTTQFFAKKTFRCTYILYTQVPLRFSWPSQNSSSVWNGKAGRRKTYMHLSKSIHIKSWTMWDCILFPLWVFFGLVDLLRKCLLSESILPEHAFTERACIAVIIFLMHTQTSRCMIVEVRWV